MYQFDCNNQFIPSESEQQALELETGTVPVFLAPVCPNTAEC